MRVLLISHTCQSVTEGQPKAHALAALPDVTLRVLVPDRWKRYGKWRNAQAPAQAAFEYQIGKVRFPWVGGAQSFLHTYPGLPRLLAKFRPDVIDLWEEPWSRVSAQAVRLRNRLLPEARIVSETEQNIDKHLPFPFEGYRSLTLKNADFVVGRNAEAVEVVRRKGYAGPADVVPNAVDAELFRPMDREKCRREMELAGFVVGYVGRLVEEKGLMDLLRAVLLCPAQVNLVLAGDGPMRQKLLDCGNNRVRILDAMPLEKLPPLMNGMDVLVLPSRTTERWKEQFGRVLIEAGACATPVIGSDSGAIPEVVAAGGLVAKERDEKSLAAAIMRLADSADLRRSLGEAGRKQALEKYTWQRVAERMRAIYEKVLSSPQA